MFKPLLNPYNTYRFYPTLFIRWVFLLVCVSLLSLQLPSSSSYAGPAGLFNKSTSEKSAKESKSEMLVDPFGRDTPRGTVQEFLKALSSHNELLASSYLQVKEGDNPITLVRKFKKALDVGGRLELNLQGNSSPEGDLSDSLPPNYDHVGSIDYQDQRIPIRMIQVTQTDDHKLWLFSQDTLEKIPEIVANSEPTLLEQYTVKSLDNTKLFDVNVVDILAVIILTFVGFLGCYILFWLIYLFVQMIYPNFRKKALPITETVILPLAVLGTSLVLPELMVYTGVSVTLREPVGRIFGIFTWVSFTWLLLRIINSTFSRAEQHSYKHKKVEQIAIISLIRRLTKIILLFLVVIVIFANFGFDLTTGIATLGIGGLALVLGLQKTIENFVGSIVVVADKPIRVGDYCRFGQYEGIVQEIGIRSTRVRTFERSIVTIPNGDFAAMQIENFTSKDMFRFLHSLYIKRNANVELIHKMIHDLDKFLQEHYLTNQEWNQVFISELRQDCYIIQCQAYVNANGMKEFFDKQNVVLIDLLKEVEKYDVEHALPTQQVVINKSD